MTTAQFFVYRRPIAWTALVATLAWGVFSYRSMPQRQDPVIPVRSGVVTTAYPGARAEKVEQEVTRKIEKKLAENPAVETVRSVSRQGLSIVFIELFDRIKNAEEVWQDLTNKLAAMPDLPKSGDQPLRPEMNKDFGDTVAVMLTISSPPVSDFEIEQRARTIRLALDAHRANLDPARRDRRRSAALVYPSSFDRDSVERLGQSLLRHLAEQGLAEDRAVFHTTGAGCLDFRLAEGRTDADLRREVDRWRHLNIGPDCGHPDIWPGVLVESTADVLTELKKVARDPRRGVDRYSYRDLRRFADLVQDRLKQSANVGKVEQIGVQEEEIYLLYSSQRVAAFGVDADQLARSLSRRNINLPGGKLETPGLSLSVRPGGEFRNEREIGEVVVATKDGYPLYMRDLADITRSYVDPPAVMNYRTVKVDAKAPPTARMPGDVVPESRESDPLPDPYQLQTTRAITLAVRQIKGTQIADFGRDIETSLESLKGVLPEDLKVEWTSNEPRRVERKIELFDQNLLEAIAIVIIVALIFMEWRSALLVAFSIPLTIAMTLGICALIGIDLQQISIAALIIALGLLVDDPVVAGDAINRELARGTPRDVAAWLGPQKLSRAILFATLTNIVAFLPLLLVTGKTGEFIYSLPVVVTASLVASRVVSMTFIPLLGYYLLKGQKGMEAGLADGTGGSRFARLYNGFTEWCLDHRFASLGACLAILVGAGSFLPMIGTAFFPKDLHDTFTVNVYMPEGSPIRQTRDESRKVIDEVDALVGRDVRAYTTFVGAGGPRFWLSVVPEQRADNYAQVLVRTVDTRVTSKVVDRLKRELPPRIAAARVTIEQLETGPPVGMPVQLRIYGRDVEELRRLAEQAKEQLRAIPGSDNIHDDWEPEVLEVSLDVRPDRANLAGLDHEDVARALNTALAGYAPTVLRDQDHLIPISLRLRPEQRNQAATLTNLEATSSSTGVRVPLSQVAEFRPETVAPRIARRNHERCLTVKSDTVPGVLPSRIVEAMSKSLAVASSDWPPGYRFEFGGEREEQEKGFKSVSVALVVSLLSIYLALVLQFNSVTKPLVVGAAVPFGMVGGLMGLLVFGAPFGFMAFLGVASLAGVIVSHIIVLFDYIEEMREQGESLHRAVIDAALVRLRPVLVTVLATVGGLIPLAIEGGPLWEPLCYVQIAGLLIATLVTKVVVPVLYVIFVEDLKLIRWDDPGARALDGPPADYALAASH
jgi:multidrug efflux pump subunit AcrB